MQNDLIILNNSNANSYNLSGDKVEELPMYYELEDFEIEVEREFINEGKSFIELLLDLYDEKILTA